MSEARLVALPADAEGVLANRIVAMMDTEFVMSRGRHGSVRQRYPDVFGSVRPGRLHALVAPDGSVLAACAERRFRPRRTEESWSGAMLGFVVTQPGERGRGVATRLLRAATEDLSRRGVDAAVLWARDPSLYRRLGWKAADPSILVRWLGEKPASDDALHPYLAPFSRETLAAIGRIRRRAPFGVARSASVYGKCPVAMDKVWGLLADQAYVLVGEARTAAYVLETAGRSESAIGLLHQAGARWPGLQLNDRVGAVLPKVLVEAGLVSISANPLGLWLPLSERFSLASAIWIPFLDRI